MKTWILFLAAAFSLNAQQISTPRPSPRATVSQTVGVTEMTVSYHRPGVKGRTIWGELVPYGQVWRAGANESTTISFSDDVTIEGQKIPAGLYGIQMIPEANEWIVILTKDAKLWGSFNYKPENDAVRIKVKPTSAEMIERLRYSFEDVNDNSTVLTMQWEKLKVAFKIETDTPNLTFTKARAAMNWSGLMQAAAYCLDNNTNLDEGMRWIDLSIGMNENYYNLRTKAQFVDKTGKRADAIKVMERAMELSKKMPSPPFDIKRMEEVLNEWKKKK
ncbi:MAG TPA: DUF2911 domain-containing protein [bacterium]|nr:DUF2911 domain-containing protein [bacterium]